MRRTAAITVAILLSCGASYAQTAMSTPGMGATSPLGIPGSSGATGTGIPLGATEIDPGGISPVPSNTMNSASACTPSNTTGGSSMTGSSTGGANSSFDGGGLSGTAAGVMSSGSCVTPTTPSTFGTASPQSTSVGTGTSSLGRPQLRGGTIPLGATELGNAGISPMVGVPAPNSLNSPCAGAIGTATSGLAAGSSGASGMAAGSTGSMGTSVPTLGSPLGC